MPSIAFSIAHSQQSYRLLELPPDLLALLAGDDAPSHLDLKAAADGDGDGHAYVCTPTRSWAVRQVSTSNSVHVTTPIAAAAGGSGSGGTSTAITAVAKPTSHLELIAAVGADPPAAEETSPWLKEVVRRVRALVPTTGTPAVKHVTHERVVGGVPYPRAWIERAMRDLVVFAAPPAAPVGGRETTDRTNGNGNGNGNGKGNGNSLGLVAGCVYRPSPELLVDAWTRFTRAAAAEGDLAALVADDVRTRRVLERVAAAGDGGADGLGDDAGEADGAVAAAVIEAVLTRFVQSDTLHARGLTRLLGRALVRAERAATTTTSTSKPPDDLARRWTALVPLSWEQFCRVDELRGADGSDDDDDRPGEGKGEGRGTESDKAGGRKRKWHDLFARERQR